MLGTLAFEHPLGWCPVDSTIRDKLSVCCAVCSSRTLLKIHFSVLTPPQSQTLHKARE